MLDFVEEPFGQIALAIEPSVESQGCDAIGHRLHIGPGAARGQGLAQGIGVVGSICQQHVAAFDGVDHVLRTAPVMGLAFGDLEPDRQAARILRDGLVLLRRVCRGGCSTAASRLLETVAVAVHGQDVNEVQSSNGSSR